MKIEVEILSLSDDSYELTGEYRIPVPGEVFTGGSGDVQRGWVGIGARHFVLRKKIPVAEVVLLRRPTVVDLWSQLGNIYDDYSVVYQCTGHSDSTKIHNLKITVDHLRKEVQLEGVSSSGLEMAE